MDYWGDSTLGLAKAEKRILLVDDDEMILLMLRRYLKKTSHFVDTAITADDALRLVQENGYHTVVSDFDMPGNNGIWLLEQTMECSPSTVRLLHSGSNPSDVSRHVASGLIHRFFQKAFQTHALIEVLSH